MLRFTTGSTLKVPRSRVNGNMHRLFYRFAHLQSTPKYSLTSLFNISPPHPRAAPEGRKVNHANRFAGQKILPLGGKIIEQVTFRALCGQISQREFSCGLYFSHYRPNLPLFGAVRHGLFKMLPFSTRAAMPVPLNPAAQFHDMQPSPPAASYKKIIAEKPKKCARPITERRCHCPVVAANPPQQGQRIFIFGP